MLNGYLQQWTAIQTVRAAKLQPEDVFMSYLGLSGDANEFEIEGYLCGLVMLPAADRDLLAHAINELLDSTGSMVDGAHYSDPDAESSSGYSDYLRTLNLSPDRYDFAAPPAGDHSTSSTTSTDIPASLDTADPGAGGPATDGHELRADVHESEFRRVQALHESRLLERGNEERFDRITRQARDHFGVSSASIALITEDSQVIKSVIGPLGQDLPRDLSLCATTIKHDRTLVITDASVHPQWRDHPLVAGGPEVRFYAGHPICTAGGWRIGTICLMDDRPRAFTDEDVQVLRRLAAQVQIEMWV
ncbi:GAF domain-containing protein [Arthrobacter cheniae]|uniref:GAF domain-containing protein n=1 Tax=Arthrobacter cheniae TaxID=1258888 RepID=A0A3A5M9X5_9MICC|nr:GAF domain-containing protein [Arthrobacter cheniae]RJT81791.1 GAF domain-containing protein [Arthrobacter cheniae]